MANLSAGEFLDKVASDANFRHQVGISDSMGIDDFQKQAAAAGYNYTNEEIIAATEAQSGGALSDEDLSAVSGGAASRIGISVKVGGVTISVSK